MGFFRKIFPKPRTPLEQYGVEMPGGIEGFIRRWVYGELARPQTVPMELTGKFIVWSPDRLKIVGSGDTAREAHAAAGGDADVLIEFIPPMSRLRPFRMVGQAEEIVP